MELELVQSLIQLVQNLSADLWQIAMRQVWVYAVEAVFTLIVCIPLLALSIRLFLNKVREIRAIAGYVDEEYTMLATLYFTGIMVFGIISYFVVYNLIQYIMNPEYAALESLLRLVQ